MYVCICMCVCVCVCVYNFELVFSFSSDKYPEIELLDYTLVLDLAF